MDRVSLRGEADAKNRPNCLNCHGAPNSQPDSRENALYHPDAEKVASVLDSFRWPHEPCKNQCNTQGHWPASLKKSQPLLQQLPFWVRSNFEKTLETTRNDGGQVTLPFRLDVAEAQLTVGLAPHQFFTEIGIKGNQVPLKVFVGPDGKLESQIQVEDNVLVLGLQKLLEAKQVRIETEVFGLDVTYVPQKLVVDGAGVLHLLGHPNWALREAVSHLPEKGIEIFVASPLYHRGTVEDPFIPPYVEDPTCMVFPFPGCVSFDPPMDLVLGQVLPKVFQATSHGQLPHTYLLEDLIYRFLKVLNRPKDKPEPPTEKKSYFGSLFTPFLFKPGSQLTLEVAHLRDFFVPGILDLGPSSGTLEIKINSEHQIEGTLEDFELNLDPADYPFPKNNQRGSVRLRYGTLKPGAATSIGLEDPIPPGIHFLYDHRQGTVNLSANLDLWVEVDPGLRVQGQILFQGELWETAEGWKVSPNFLLGLKGVKVVDGLGQAWVENLDLNLVGPKWSLPQNSQPHKVYLTDQARLNLEIQFPGKKKLAMQGSGKLPLTPDGSLDFKKLVSDLDFLLFSQWTQDEGRNLYFSFDLQGDPLAAPVSPGGTSYRYHGELEGIQKLPDREKIFSLIHGGDLDLQILKDAGGHYQIDFNFQGEKLRLPQFLSQGLAFNGLLLDFQVKDMEFSEELWAATFPRFRIEVNSEGSSQGLIRGPVRIFQDPNGSFRLSRRPTKELLAVEGLNWNFEAQQVVLPRKVRKYFMPGTHSLGMDARLSIDFYLNTPPQLRDWNGAGVIQLLGDSGGDLYPLNVRGKRIGVPIFRKTQWKWTRLDRVHPYGRYPIGNGHLETWINPASVGDIPPDLLQSKMEYEGIPVASHPYEFRFTMDYDNQPLTWEGFQYKIQEYLLQECLTIPHCRDSLKQKGGTP